MVLDCLSMSYRYLSAVILIAFLAACAGSPEQSSEEAVTVPEITLNLPNGGCDCSKTQAQDLTFLEKGFDALREGEYLDSLLYFQRYQRIEKTSLAESQAHIAIAYLSILPDSPILDRPAAREAYAQIQIRPEDVAKMHQMILLMRDSLETFLDMESQIERLRQDDNELRRELDKREVAIKRLRDLTLGREPEPAALPGR